MSRREVPAITLGTYYTTRGGHSRANDSTMRNYVYIAKDDYSGSGVSIEHPRHPSGKARFIASPAEAHTYFAEIIAEHAARIRKRLQIDEDYPVTLIPVPTSQTTSATLDATRWPGRDLAYALERHGFGKTMLSLAFKKAHQAKHAGGGTLSAHELCAELELLEVPDEDDTIVLIDDVITWGHHTAAADAKLRNGNVVALAVATTDSGLRDAYDPRHRIISYDPSKKPWDVKVADMDSP